MRDELLAAISGLARKLLRDHLQDLVLLELLTVDVQRQVVRVNNALHLQATDALDESARLPLPLDLRDKLKTTIFRIRTHCELENALNF